MARYLPQQYEPIPDALLYGGADLVDVTRRIARNQNFLWAKGGVLACFGQEPIPYTSVGVNGTEVTGVIATFACPNESATGSDRVRCRGYVTTTGAGIDFRVRLYQLLPGEESPGADTPYDDGTITTVGADVAFDFTARVRSGSDPLRFSLKLIGNCGGGNTATLLTVTVNWEENPTSVLGETVAPWSAIAQGYVTPDRPASAALLRAISNRTLGLVARDPRPIYTHSFVWPRISTAAAGAETRVGLWYVADDGLYGVTPLLAVSAYYLLTGQSAQVTYRLKVNGVTQDTVTVSGTALADGAYVKVTSIPFVFLSYVVASGPLKVEITAQCSVGATSPPTYCTNVGAVLLNFDAWSLRRNRVALGLPGLDDIPAAYEPIDDNAVAPGSRAVAQNDRIGRRAGPYYLVRNLMWLASYRGPQHLIADWIHSTQVAGWTVTNDPGDGYLRNGTVYSEWLLPGPNEVYERAPASRSAIPWADRLAPTNANKVSAGGHHYVGDTLALKYLVPRNGSTRIRGLLRPDVVYPPNAPGFTGDAVVDALWGLYPNAQRFASFPASRDGLEGGFRSFQASLPSTAGTLYLRGNAGIVPGSSGVAYRIGQASGMQVALHSAYIEEAPLTQDDLDALA